jgi:hypothetical protein
MIIRKTMKKSGLGKLRGSLIGGILIAAVFLSIQGVVFAAGESTSTTTSVLPQTVDSITGEKCLTDKELNPDLATRKVIEDILKGPSQEKINNILGCGIKTGNIKLYMIPYYIRAILEFVIGISGLACVGAIVFGGYWYLFAGISEDKEKGKKAILYGLVGMVLTLVAWAVVNILISLLTM